MEIFCKHSNLSNATSVVVKRMLSDAELNNEGRTIFMDNYYQSPNLAQDLLLEGTNSVGTLIDMERRPNSKPMLKLSLPGRWITDAKVFYV